MRRNRNQDDEQRATDGDDERDDRLAEVISFIRYAWGNEAPPVTKENVAAFRRMHAARATPWTDSELNKLAEP